MIESRDTVDVLDSRVRRFTLELERVVWTVSPKNWSIDQLAVFIERFARILFDDLPIRLRVHGRDGIPARPITPECQHHVLAVTEEAINNALKHSRATETVVALLEMTNGGMPCSVSARAQSAPRSAPQPLTSCSPENMPQIGGIK